MEGRCKNGSRGAGGKEVAEKTRKKEEGGHRSWQGPRVAGIANECFT